MIKPILFLPSYILRLFVLMLSVASFSIPSLAISAPQNELVLRENTELKAHTSSGDITIVAGKDIERKYEWDGCSLSADMQKRKGRWFGSMGIYDPASRLFGSLFSSSCKGISRTVVQEGQIHFANETDAEHWVSMYAKHYPTVWSDDGLLVQWDLVPSREQVNVNLWQICINGQMPKKLAGASKNAITVLPASGRFECAAVSDEVKENTLKDWQDLWDGRP